MTGNTPPFHTGERFPPPEVGTFAKAGNQESQTGAGEGISGKAIALIERGDVTLRFVQAHRVKATVRDFDVSDVFDVTLIREQWRCSCPARLECVHIFAVALVTEEPPEPSPMTFTQNHEALYTTSIAVPATEKCHTTLSQ